MKKAKQLQFGFTPQPKLTHGGEYTKGKRKTERPLKMNRPIHLVLRANRSGLKRRERSILKIMKTYAERFQIKLYKQSVNSNHLHLIVTVARREDFQNYLRSITGLIAKLMGEGKLWMCLAFTRVGDWGRQYQAM